MTDTRAKLLQYINDLLQGTNEPPPVTVPEEPPDLGGFLRQIRVIDDPPEWVRPERITLEAARARIMDSALAYLDTDMPGHMLLIKAAPGVGKTTMAVEIAEWLAAEGKRVMYAGPRHDFYADIIAKATRLSWWYEWLPRQVGTEGKIETCAYAEDMATWLYRGYDAMEFCRRICGWDYVNNLCPYHAQKRTKAPIVFCQHQHVVSGHPLEFDVVIGDEQPISAFANHWRIPARWVSAPGMSPTEPLAEVLHILSRLADEDAKAEGEDLLTLLGGPDHVLGACEGWIMPTTAAVIPPEIFSARDAERVPFAFLQHLAPLLAREAAAAAEGRPYPHRIIVANGHLSLLLRNPPSDKLPPHVLWLDATASPRLYEATFRRRAQVVDAQPALQGTIYQVYDRYNGKSSLIDKDGKQTSKAGQLEQQVQRIIETRGYKAPAIISFKDLVEGLESFSGLDHAHFHAARGTNSLEDADCLIVAGTPQPSTTEMEFMARMIFWERMTAFQPEFTARELPYSYVDTEGKGRAYPVSGFWGDPDLQAILWSVREAELIQAAHRCRPVNKPVDIWLLTNVPLPELPPAELISIRELMGAPEGVDIYRWPEVLELAQELGTVTTSDLMGYFNLDRHTAYRYLDQLVETGEFERAVVKTGKRGRPPAAVRLRNKGA